MTNKPAPTHIRQVSDIQILKPSHPQLRRLKAQHNPTSQGYKLWNSTWLLLDFLARHSLPTSPRILDVGCGWGLSGISCARRYNAHVTAADIDSEVFPFLELHAQINEVKIRTLHASFEQIPTAVLERQDLLIGADICFRSHLVDPLFGLIERALEAGVQQIALADPGRFSFKQLATRCVAELGANQQEWKVEEPMISWSGAGMSIRGQLIHIDNLDRQETDPEAT